jgi:hypothetical protein
MGGGFRENRQQIREASESLGSLQVHSGRRFDPGPSTRRTPIRAGILPMLTAHRVIPSRGHIADLMRATFAQTHVACLLSNGVQGCFTTRHEMQAYLRRRLDSFTNPLVYTFWATKARA